MRADALTEMADFIDDDLPAARFEHVDLRHAELRDVDLTSRFRFRGVDLSGVVMRGVALCDVDIHGEVGSTTCTPSGTSTPSSSAAHSAASPGASF